MAYETAAHVFRKEIPQLPITIIVKIIKRRMGARARGGESVWVDDVFITKIR